MSAAEVIARAREFLDGTRKRKAAGMPLALLIREDVELRRLLGQVLDVIGEWELPAGTALTPEQRATMLAALDEAAEYKRDRAATCSDCNAHPAGLCTTCESRLARAEEYDALAKALRGAS